MTSLKSGQVVEIRFNNGTFFDAIVEEWTDQKSIVKLIGSDDHVVIHNTNDNVIMVRVFDENSPKHPLKKNTPIASNLNIEEMTQKMQSLKLGNKDDDSLSEMAKLQDGINMLDRQQVLEQFHSNVPSGAREFSYGSFNIPVKCAPQYTIEKAASRNNALGKGLQAVFNKKHTDS